MNLERFLPKKVLYNFPTLYPFLKGTLLTPEQIIAPVRKSAQKKTPLFWTLTFKLYVYRVRVYESHKKKFNWLRVFPMDLNAQKEILKKYHKRYPLIIPFAVSYFCREKTNEIFEKKYDVETLNQKFLEFVDDFVKNIDSYPPLKISKGTLVFRSDLSIPRYEGSFVIELSPSMYVVGFPVTDSSLDFDLAITSLGYVDIKTKKGMVTFVDPLPYSEDPLFFFRREMYNLEEHLKKLNDVELENQKAVLFASHFIMKYPKTFKFLLSENEKFASMLIDKLIEFDKKYFVPYALSSDYYKYPIDLDDLLFDIHMLKYLPDKGYLGIYIRNPDKGLSLFAYAPSQYKVVRNFGYMISNKLCAIILWDEKEGIKRVFYADPIVFYMILVYFKKEDDIENFLKNYLFPLLKAGFVKEVRITLPDLVEEFAKLFGIYNSETMKRAYVFPFKIKRKCPRGIIIFIYHATKFEDLLKPSFWNILRQVNIYYNKVIVFITDIPISKWNIPEKLADMIYQCSEYIILKWGQSFI